MLAWNHWTGAGATFRLSLVLVLAVILLLPMPLPDRKQLLWLAAILSAYVIPVCALQMLGGGGGNQRRQAFLISVLMLLFIVGIGWIFKQQAVALVLLVPVVNAALRLAGRQMITIVVLAGFAWSGLHAMNGIPAMSNWPVIAIGLLPIILTALVIRSLRSDIDLARNRLTALSYQDELSGTLNMRAFTRLLLSAHAKAEEDDLSYALIMVDIENLQALNEKYGHEQGNRVIVAVAEALKRSIRSADLVARYGGDEFIIYLSDANEAIAEEVRNRVTQNVYNITLSFERKMQRLKVNAGMAVYPAHGKTIQRMMSYAHKSMHLEKDFQRRVKDDRTGARRRMQAGVKVKARTP